MRRFLHAWWPVAAVVIFTATLVLQIPRKALFFVPVASDPDEAFVSFVTLDDASYAQLVSRIRMAWQMQGKPLAGGIADCRTDAFDFSDALPPPSYLPLPAGTAEVSLPPLPPPRSSLLPPSLGLETPPIPVVAVRPDRDPGLLALPGCPSDAGPPYDFTLKTPRSIIK